MIACNIEDLQEEPIMDLRGDDLEAQVAGEGLGIFRATLLDATGGGEPSMRTVR